MTKVKANPGGARPRVAAASTGPRVLAFDAGKSGRRLRSLPTTSAAINAQIRQYGRTVLARSRYLASNNPYAAAAKEAFVSAMVGAGIKPSSMTADPALKAELQELWLDWTDEADADWLTDLYGLQSIIAAEMFEAGECFVRMRSRLSRDGLTVPLQLQVLPAEMLPLDHNGILSGGRTIQCGIEFDAIGRRNAYHFLRQHPGDNLNLKLGASLKTIVPADEVLHLYRPVRAGQIRGLPHTISAIVKLAIMDQYDDAELERKRTAALFGAFITKAMPEGDGSVGVGPLEGETQQENGKKATQPENVIGLEPGATVDLDPGEDIKFATPADVGNSYEAFQYRTLLSIAAGFGVPYAAMTGDLRQTSYGSIRAGLVEFRRRVEAMQHHVMVYQFCRPVWRRWMTEAVLSGAVSISPTDFVKRTRELMRVKWITPKWEWIDPLKDLEAEKLAVRAGFKARSDVIEASGYDPEETDARIAADKKRARDADIIFDSDAGMVSNAGVTNARPQGTAPTPDEPLDDNGETKPPAQQD